MIRGSFKGGKKKKKGFILMEVIVAMTLLALIMTPLAAMVFKITARSHRSIGNTYLNAVLMDQVNYLEAVPIRQPHRRRNANRDHHGDAVPAHRDGDRHAVLRQVDAQGEESRIHRHADESALQA